MRNYYTVPFDDSSGFVRLEHVRKPPPPWKPPISYSTFRLVLNVLTVRFGLRLMSHDGNERFRFGYRGFPDML